MQQLITSNAASHIEILICLVNNRFGSILGDANDKFIVDLHTLLSGNAPSTSGINEHNTDSKSGISQSLKRKCTKVPKKLKEPKFEKEYRTYDKAELDNWREIARELIVEYEQTAEYNFEGTIEQPRPPRDENDFKIFHPNMKDLENFEAYYEKILLPWSVYYGGITLRMPKDWLDLLPSKPIMSNPSLILKAHVMNYTRYNDKIMKFSYQPLENFYSMQDYYDLIQQYSSRNELRQDNDYSDNIKEVKAMFEQGKFPEAPYVSDIEIEYLMKDVEGAFNFRNFHNILRAFANYDDREFPGLTKAMAYAGSFASSSSTHFEDFNSNSLNLLVFGAEKLWKIWRAGKLCKFK